MPSFQNSNVKFIDTFEDDIYFYESNSEKFYKINKFNKNLEVLTAGKYSDISGFQIIHDLKSRIAKRDIGCDLTEYYLCKNNKCIHKSLLCNGYDNCDDNSDEDRNTVCKNFTCNGPNQYDCGMNYCIPNSKLCDLVSDCPNAADEILCKSKILS